MSEVSADKMERPFELIEVERDRDAYQLKDLLNGKITRILLFGAMSFLWGTVFAMTICDEESSTQVQEELF